jgi:hypothetical protein
MEIRLTHNAARVSFKRGGSGKKEKDNAETRRASQKRAEGGTAAKALILRTCGAAVLHPYRFGAY